MVAIQSDLFHPSPEFFGKVLSNFKALQGIFGISKYLIPTMGTIFEVRRELLSATGTSIGRLRVKEISLRPALFVKNPATAVAFQKRLSSFNGNQRNEEEADIMIQPFAPGRRQATVRAGPGLIIDLNLLRLHSTDKDEGAPPLNDVSNCRGARLRARYWARAACPYLTRLL
jgi:hypothetical protein